MLQSTSPWLGVAEALPLAIKYPGGRAPGANVNLKPLQSLTSRQVGTYLPPSEVTSSLHWHCSTLFTTSLNFVWEICPAMSGRCVFWICGKRCICCCGGDAARRVPPRRLTPLLLPPSLSCLRRSNPRLAWKGWHRVISKSLKNCPQVFERLPPAPPKCSTTSLGRASSGPWSEKVQISLGPLWYGYIGDILLMLDIFIYW